MSSRNSSGGFRAVNLMIDKVGRNEPCPCGSGKKYKNCCFSKKQQKKSPLGGRKFKATVLSAGGLNKPHPQNQDQGQAKLAIDYTTLMERSFGEALHSHEDKPPIPPDPSKYLVSKESNQPSH